MNKLGTLAFLTVSVGVLAAGCGSDPPPPPKGPDDVVPQVAAEKPKAPPKEVDTAKPTSGSVQIDDKIVKACGNLPTAHFAFDSAEIEGAAADVLAAVARCFVSGPLQGKGLKLIGHADARGETEYNLALGQKRAGSVGEFLTQKGLESGRIAVSSKGEFEATGTDEEGWALDRKVQVLLAE